MAHLHVALEFGEEITEEQLHAPFKNNPLHYIALHICRRRLITKPDGVFTEIQNGEARNKDDDTARTQQMTS
ncbi:hypothetical protein PHYSODRAFT_341285 [Phytophthora sojae]|uniref:Uncharacterized protein n=1 Tax=Phytophthora sojae (strain P6497) TaxID=1094619 RepID=G5ACQ0_PHYSP|nr:hypothetical protein PHYSODRAFT_341285 [Phytophthora sojae]EGZ07124.1 hypothetical protein PHYSODRAFT_341285 [Phytophthora sojae]|eukprot:XP_009537888.1 hypothetical protein PHYSODRAFT_341285 [Phytophthora sojae]